MEVLGIDIGGSGIKAALVSIETGALTSERFRLPTPRPATPENVVKTIAEIVQYFKWQGAVSCGFPTPMHQGVCLSGGNLHDSWKGVPLVEFFSKSLRNKFSVINDADAAGIAEVYFGAGRNYKGKILVTTLGTGIGSALFINGVLFPNTELGHIFTKKGEIFEKYAADSIRKQQDLSYKKWGKRLENYFKHIELILSPDLIIIGGGASKKLSKFIDYITVDIPIVAAELKNNAGIIGAALAFNLNST